MAGLLIAPNVMPARDRDGYPISGARLYVFLNHTTTLTTVYTDAGLTVPAANPIVADSSGDFGLIYGPANAVYTVAFTDAQGAPLAAFDDVSLSVALSTGAVLAALAAATGNIPVNGALNPADNLAIKWGAGDTSIVASAAADLLDLYVAGAIMLRVKAGGVEARGPLSATELDLPDNSGLKWGDGSVSIAGNGAVDLMDIYAGGVRQARVSTSGVDVSGLTVNGAAVAQADLGNVNPALLAPTIGGLAVGENLLPNTQHEVNTAGAQSARIKADGTAPEPNLTVTSNSTGSALTTLNCAATGNLAVGDYVAAVSGAPAQLSVCAMRVVALTPNVSFQVYAPRGAAVTASSTATYMIAGWGDYAGAGGSAQDGWVKSTGLRYMRNLFRANMPSGAVGSGYFKKSTSASQFTYWEATKAELSSFLGRTIVFTSKVKQPVRGGAFSARAFITTGVGGVGTITYGADMDHSPVDADGFTCLQVSAYVPTNTDVLDVGVSFDGAASDIYYQGNAHLQFGSFLPIGAYKRPVNEILFPVVKITPFSYDAATITLPASLTPSTPFYDITFDCSAETNLVIAPSVTAIHHAQAECRGTVGHPLAFRNVAGPPGIKFGLSPIYPQVTGVTITSGGMWTLDLDGKGLIYGTNASDTFTLVSIDLNAFLLNPSRGSQV